MRSPTEKTSLGGAQVAGSPVVSDEKQPQEDTVLYKQKWAALFAADKSGKLGGVPIMEEGRVVYSSRPDVTKR